MARSETTITVVFVMLAVGLWLVVRTLTESMAIQGLVLVGIGVIAPTLLSEWRSDTADERHDS